MALRRVVLFSVACGVIGSHALACSGGDGGSDVDAGFPNPSTSSGREPGGGQTSGGTFGGGSGGHSSGRVNNSSSGRAGDEDGGTEDDGGGSSGESSSSGQPGCDDPDDAPDDGTVNGFTDVTVTQTQRFTGTQAGVLNGGSDIDWYGYDIIGSPVTSITSYDVAPLELCVYMSCHDGTLTLTCKSGTAAVDEFGEQGCCSSGDDIDTALVETTQYCSGGSSGGVTADDAFAYVSVTSKAEQCASYTVDVQF